MESWLPQPKTNLTYELGFDISFAVQVLWTGSKKNVRGGIELEPKTQVQIMRLGKARGSESRLSLSTCEAMRLQLQWVLVNKIVGCFFGVWYMYSRDREGPIGRGHWLSPHLDCSGDGRARSSQGAHCMISAVNCPGGAAPTGCHGRSVV